MEAENNEEKEEVKKKVVQLSVQSGVSSSFTAFIVVNTDNNKEIQGPVLHRDIPMAGLMRCAATPCCYSSSFSSEFPHAKKPPRDPLLQLVSLQKASGCWLLDAALAAALGKTNEEVEKSKPEKASSEVWATILALIWLHGFKMDAKDEWELLAAKAVSWLSAQKAPSVTECVEARNILLGCSVQKNCPWPLRFLLS
uniref:von Willebrand factor A domain containing 5A n=1 Tax=Oreochromis aureus TaxID=47969 RepID=A0AAZ1XDG8_OREAU